MLKQEVKYFNQFGKNLKTQGSGTKSVTGLK